MPDIDDTMTPVDAKIDAAQILTGLARLLRSDDPQMHDLDRRRDHAALFGRIANTLLAEEGLDKDYIRHASEWTRGLSFLLGIHDRQTRFPANEYPHQVQVECRRVQSPPHRHAP